MLFSDIDTAVCSGGALLQFVGLSVSIVIDYTFIQGRQEYTLGILVRVIFFGSGEKGEGHWPPGGFWVVLAKHFALRL